METHTLPVPVFLVIHTNTKQMHEHDTAATALPANAVDGAGLSSDFRVEGGDYGQVRGVCTVGLISRTEAGVKNRGKGRGGGSTHHTA